MITSRQMRSAINTLPPKSAVDLPKSAADLAKNDRVVVEQLAPIDIRVIQWITYQIWTPRRIIRLLLWAFKKVAHWYIMARTFSLAMVGGKISDAEYNTRQLICYECNANRLDYCQSCGCWKWPPAKLKTKNRLREWRCPEMHHPGRYIKWYHRKFRSSCSGNKPQMGTNSHPASITEPYQTGAR